MAHGPDPVAVVNAAGASPYVLLCEHASAWMPPDYAGLGLQAADLARHIAWDIGAADVARILSQRLDAPLILAGASRLLIDLNRPLGSATSIPVQSEATVIPGNIGIGAAERQRRAAAWFHPFHDRVAAFLDTRQAKAQPTRIIAVHSFTPVFLGVPRPWTAGVLYRRSQAFGAALVEALGGAAAGVAHNQPYQIDSGSDYSVPVHGEARGLDAVLVELRQDIVGTGEGAAVWADRLAGALTETERFGL